MTGTSTCDSSRFLDGHTVAVFGASRGIGRATASAFARAGARVALVARSGLGCADGANRIVAEGGQAMAASCDVSDSRAVRRVFEDVRDAYGCIDCVVNNAGIIDPIGSIDTIDPDEWSALVAINLCGAFNVAQQGIVHMRDSKSGGTLLNLSSGAAHRPLEGWSAYCASKAGLTMLTQSIALEFEGSSLRTIGVRPGVVDTQMQAKIRSSGINAVSRLKQEDLLDPELPARLMVWLCHPDAADLNGQEIDIRDPEIAIRAGLPPIAS